MSQLLFCSSGLKRVLCNIGYTWLYMQYDAIRCTVMQCDAIWCKWWYQCVDLYGWALLHNRLAIHQHAAEGEQVHIHLCRPSCKSVNVALRGTHTLMSSTLMFLRPLVVNTWRGLAPNSSGYQWWIRSWPGRVGSSYVPDLRRRRPARCQWCNFLSTSFDRGQDYCSKHLSNK